MQMFLEPRLRSSEEETKTRAHVDAAEKIIPGLEQCRGELCSAQETGMSIQGVFLNPGTARSSEISSPGSFSLL